MATVTHMATGVSDRRKRGSTTNGAVWRSAALRAAALTAAIALVAACSGGGAAEESTTTPPAPVPAPSTPTPTPTLPYDADGIPIVAPAPESLPGEDLEGAVQGTHEFLSAYLEGVQKKTSVPLREVSEPACGYCLLKIRLIDEKVAAGETVDPDFTWHVEEYYAEGPDEEFDYHGVLAMLTTENWRFLDPSGEIVEEFPDRTANLYVGIRKSQGGWTVVEVSAIYDEAAVRVASNMVQLK